MNYRTGRAAARIVTTLVMLLGLISMTAFSAAAAPGGLSEVQTARSQGANTVLVCNVDAQGG